MTENTKENLRQLIFEGFTISYKDVSICDLRAYLPHRLNHTREYQVSSNNWLENYHYLEDAVNKYEELVDQRMAKLRK